MSSFTDNKYELFKIELVDLIMRTSYNKTEYRMLVNFIDEEYWHDLLEYVRGKYKYIQNMSAHNYTEELHQNYRLTKNLADAISYFLINGLNDNDLFLQN
jgi:hypothetical protein